MIKYEILNCICNYQNSQFAKLFILGFLSYKCGWLATFIALLTLYWFLLFEGGRSPLHRFLLGIWASWFFAIEALINLLIGFFVCRFLNLNLQFFFFLQFELFLHLFCVFLYVKNALYYLIKGQGVVWNFNLWVKVEYCFGPMLNK